MSMQTWTTDRIDQLRNFVGAGLTCSQIAAEIGVTRNSVIGKIHRLGLGPGRPAAAHGHASPSPIRRRPLSLQRKFLQMIATETAAPGAVAASSPALVESTQRCSLLELTHDQCRWPISDPGAVDFAFCGNRTTAGFSYCAGHAHLAYRPASRRRA